MVSWCLTLASRGKLHLISKTWLSIYSFWETWSEVSVSQSGCICSETCDHISSHFVHKNHRMLFFTSLSIGSWVCVCSCVCVIVGAGVGENRKWEKPRKSESVVGKMITNKLKITISIQQFKICLLKFTMDIGLFSYLDFFFCKWCHTLLKEVFFGRSIWINYWRFYRLWYICIYFYIHSVLWSWYFQGWISMFVNWISLSSSFFFFTFVHSSRSDGKWCINHLLLKRERRLNCEW